MTNGLPQPELRRLKLRYDGECATCGIPLSKGAEAFWSRATKALCLACGPEAVDAEVGIAGASAAAEGERRKDTKVEAVRRRYGDHAAAVAEELAGRDTAATWGKGSEGESWLASYVREKVGDVVIPLHDRLMPGTRGNVDHIFVTPTGVWVVDAKAYEGKVEQRQQGPFWRPDNRVYVGGRNRTALAQGVERQREAVLAALKGYPEAKGVQVQGALCFVNWEWSLLDLSFVVGRVWVMQPHVLRKRLKKEGPVARETMERIAGRLELSLPAAS